VLIVNVDCVCPLPINRPISLPKANRYSELQYLQMNTLFWQNHFTKLPRKIKDGRIQHGCQTIQLDKQAGIEQLCGGIFNGQIGYYDVAKQNAGQPKAQINYHQHKYGLIYLMAHPWISIANLPNCQMN
jgi:hypothetical protein